MLRCRLGTAGAKALAFGAAEYTVGSSERGGRVARQVLRMETVMGLSGLMVNQQRARSCGQTEEFTHLGAALRQTTALRGVT